MFQYSDNEKWYFTKINGNKQCCAASYTSIHISWLNIEKRFIKDFPEEASISAISGTMYSCNLSISVPWQHNLDYFYFCNLGCLFILDPITVLISTINDRGHFVNRTKCKQCLDNKSFTEMFFVKFLQKLFWSVIILL